MILHKHGQHTWHFHGSEEYNKHQEPIENEVIHIVGIRVPNPDEVLVFTADKHSVTGEWEYFATYQPKAGWDPSEDNGFIAD